MKHLRSWINGDVTLRHTLKSTMMLTSLLWILFSFQYFISVVAAIDPCDIKPCGRLDIHNCTSDNGTFSCQCAPGYEAEPNEPCKNIDECYTHSHSCPLRTLCEDTEGSYNCLCRKGYQKNSTGGHECFDIDECAEGTHDCDIPPKAECHNLDGSFFCECLFPFFGSLGTEGDCLEERFFEMPNINMVELPQLRESDNAVAPLIFAPIGVPVFGGSYRAFHITKNGLIVMLDVTEDTKDSWIPKTFQNPSKHKLERFRFFDNTWKERALIAPYWAVSTLPDKLQFSEGVFYEVITKEDVLREFSRKRKLDLLKNPKWALAVEWKFMQHPSEPYLLMQFQAVIVTDFMNTVVVFIYSDGFIWRPIMETHFFPVRVGYVIREGSSSVYKSEEYVHSYPPITDQEALEGIQFINQYNQSGVKSIVGAGIFKYALSDNNSSMVPPDIGCIDWAIKQYTVQQTYGDIDPEDVHSCPCTRKQVTDRWVMTETHDDHVCFKIDPNQNRLVVPGMGPGSGVADAGLSGGSGSGAGGSGAVGSGEEESLVWQSSEKNSTSHCCYRTQGIAADSLITDPMDNGQNIYQRFTDNTEDNLAYKQCCHPSSSYCTYYLMLRPICTCQYFKPPGNAFLYGGSHIKTLDGAAYTLYGLGEYNLLSAISLEGDLFHLQGRTVLMKNLTNATVFGSVALQQTYSGRNSSSRVQIRLTESYDEMELLIDGELVTNSVNLSTLQGQEFRDVVVKLENDTTYSVTFFSGINVKITQSISRMSILISVPQDWKYLTSGLLGDFDGNRTNDIMYQNGDVLPSDYSTDSLIDVVESWKISSDDSLFVYPEDTNSIYNKNTTYVPQIFDMNTMFLNETFKNLAVNLCNISEPCLYDSAVSNDLTIGQVTLNEEMAYDNLTTIMENFPPQVSNQPVVLNITNGEDLSMSLYADDKNNDTFSWFILPPIPEGVTIDTNGVISWTNTSQIEGNVKVSVGVQDSQGATSVVMAKILYCYCQHGSCIWLEGEAPFLELPCSCNSGWGGLHCDQDFDGCASLPCYGKCQDLPPDSGVLEGYVCEPCPFDKMDYSLKINGSICADRNECHESDYTICGSEQYCKNTLGSYSCVSGQVFDWCVMNPDFCDSNSECDEETHECSCNKGFDKTSSSVCYDINECSHGFHTCSNNSVCVNTYGSFECECYPGYQMDPLGECEDIDECGTGIYRICEQDCINHPGSYECLCFHGYELDPTDNKCKAMNSSCSADIQEFCNGECSVAPDNTMECPCVHDIFRTCNASENYCESMSMFCDEITSDCVQTDSVVECKCKEGYETVNGLLCTDIDECERPDLNTCDETKSSCVNTIGSFSCACAQGFMRTTDGGCAAVNGCNSTFISFYCNSHSTCVFMDSQSMCLCDSGFMVTENSGMPVCDDIDECSPTNEAEARNPPCDHRCINTMGSYFCKCFNGFEFDSDGKTCIDIDECSNDLTHSCNNATYCLNTVGSFECSCPEGFQLQSDMQTCKAVTPCPPDHGCSHSCAVIGQENICQCPPGYELDPENNMQCIDIDECTVDAAVVCPTENNVNCVNTEGGYQCQCVNDTFYRRIEINLCIDIDECQNITSCPDDSNCINTVPGFHCECKKGFKETEENGHFACIDINECTAEYSYGDCADTDTKCKNLPGEHVCECSTGYELVMSDSGPICSDVDECIEDFYCNTNRSNCINTEGSYQCSCFEGYQNLNEVECADVDECLSREANCQQKCVNKVGSYECQCSIGFKKDSDTTCKAIVPCLDQRHCPDDHLCTRLGSYDICTCKNDDFIMIGTFCYDKDECLDDPCQGSASCVNEAPGYRCTCEDGYKLTEDGLSCRDRDGGYTDWSEWGPCNETCNYNDFLKRSRSCTNPEPAGYGKTCKDLGPPLEYKRCISEPCPLEDLFMTNGVRLVANSTILLHEFVNDILIFMTSYIDTTVNAMCSDLLFEQCCPGRGMRKNPTEKLPMTSVGSVRQAISYPWLYGEDMVDFMIAVVVDEDNPLCMDGSDSPIVKREAGTVNVTETSQVALSQEVLLQILENNDLQNYAEQRLKEEFGYISFLYAEKATRWTTSTTTKSTTTKRTTTPTTTEPPVKREEIPNDTKKLAPWIIPVAVGCAVVLVFFIIVCVVKLCLTKRALDKKNKDASSQPDASSKPSTSSSHRPVSATTSQQTLVQNAEMVSMVSFEGTNETELENSSRSSPGSNKQLEVTNHGQPPEPSDGSQNV